MSMKLDKYSFHLKVISPVIKVSIVVANFIKRKIHTHSNTHSATPVYSVKALTVYLFARQFGPNYLRTG